MLKKVLMSYFILLAVLFVLIGVSASERVYAESSVFTVSEYTVDTSDYLFTLDFQEGVEVTDVTSSNKSVITVDELFSSFVYLCVEGEPGTSIITATCADGKTGTCKVTVKPDEFVMGETEVTFSSYGDEDDCVYVPSKTNYIKSVTISDGTIAKAAIYEKTEIIITPLAAGTATITVKDIYNQTATIDVTITKKYIDEKKYLEVLTDACIGKEMHYGDTRIEFETVSSKLKYADIQVNIGGKNYPGKYTGFDGYYHVYAFNNIPILPVGTKTKYMLSIGEASYTYSSTIKPGDLYYSGELYIGNDGTLEYSYYSGKRMMPKVEVDFNAFDDNERFTVLRQGIDYTVKYTNNLNVGTAKVTVTGKGNYRGSLSDTFKILPKGTSLSKLKADKKKITVKWKKQAAKMSKSRITGYQLCYSTKKSMSGAVKKNIKGYKKTSKTLKKLKANTKYFIQIRTYKKIGKKVYYSKWSKMKSVKTK